MSPPAEEASGGSPAAPWLTALVASVSLSLPTASFAGPACGPATSVATNEADAEAQSGPRRADGWNVTAARGERREMRFEVSEGTWMSIDASPDGEFLLFDLLGHIYRLDRGKETARNLTRDSGLAVNSQPRVSPDGSMIAFISDRLGHANLWVMNADGSRPRLLEDEPDVRVSEPAWHPSGKRLVAQRKVNGIRYTSRGLWEYSLESGKRRRVATGETGSPTISPDGEYLYFHRHDAADPDFLSIERDYGIFRARLDAMDAGDELVLNGAIAPSLSPDGRYLAFARRMPGKNLSHGGVEYGPRTALWVRDVVSDAENLVLDPIEMDTAETYGFSNLPTRALPAFGWAPDGEAVYVSQHGKIRRASRDGSKVSTIPFEAVVERELSEMARAERSIDLSETVRSSYLRWGRTSPDGEWLAVQAFGRIWLLRAESTDAQPRRLTPSSFPSLEYSPAWSPDSRAIAFTGRSPDGSMAIWVAHVASGDPRVLRRSSGAVFNLQWSPDGKNLVYTAAAEDVRTGRFPYHAPTREIRSLSADGTEDELLLVNPRADRSRALPSVVFGPQGRVYLTIDRKTPDNLFTELHSLAPGSGRTGPHLVTAYADKMAPAPDGRWIAVQKGADVYLVDRRKTPEGAFVELRQKKGDARSLRARRISPLGGIDPFWLSDGRVEFVAADRHYVYDPATAKLTARRIEIAVPRRRGTGAFAFTGARLVTLEDDGVLEGADLIIDDGRIACLGDCETAGLEKVFDASGKTIIPGIVDVHNSSLALWERVTPFRHFRMQADFAFGVTTGFSPSGWSEVSYPTAELIEAGIVTGPRLFSAADKFRWDPEPYYVEGADYADIEREVRKRKAFGAAAIKQYWRERDRADRQKLAVAAREHGLPITAHLQEGNLEYGLSLVLDGYTAVQHTPLQLPYYEDMVRFYGEARFGHNATVAIAGGAINEQYYLRRFDFSRIPRLRRFLPSDSLRAEFALPVRPKHEYGLALHALGFRQIVEHGGYVSVAGHGTRPGLSPHFDIWILAEAMAPVDALRSASLHGAHFLGLEDDIGSLAIHKVADFVVLDSDPLTDIRNTLDARFIVKAGIVHDAATLEILHE